MFNRNKTRYESKFLSKVFNNFFFDTILGHEDSDEENVSPTSPSYKSKYGDIALANRRTSRSGYTYRTREQSPTPEDETGMKFITNSDENTLKLNLFNH